MKMVVPGGGVFRGVVEQIEQHLLEQHGIERHHRHVGARGRVATDDAAGFCGRARNVEPTISDRSCGASFGATAPDSSLVMSSRLAMKRLSRSDSSMIVASSSAFSPSVSLSARSRSVPAEPSTEASGVFRSWEIEVSSAERNRSVSAVRSTRSMSSTSCTRSMASAP